MKKKIIVTLFFSLIVLGAVSIKSFAAVTATSATTTSGKNVTISVNSSVNLGSCILKVTDKGGLTLVDLNTQSGEKKGDLLAVSSSAGVKNLGTFTFKAPVVDKDTKYTVKFSATAMEKPDLSELGDEYPTAVVTVKVKEQVAEPKFTSVNQTVYAKSETNVRESYSTASKSLGMLKAGESLVRVGVGDNGWSKVNFNGKTAYIYSNNLTTTKVEESKSADKTLQSLKIAEGTLDPEFNPETTKYSVTIPGTVDKASIEAIASSEKAKVEVAGNEKLVMGSNIIKITVTAEDGTTRIYNLEVIKSNQVLQLSKLSIPGITLDPEFKPDVYKYTIKLEPNSTVSDFAIQAETDIKDATVEIIGNSNLKEGENTITILVNSTDRKEQTSYQIIVNKPASTEDKLFTGKNKTIDIALVAIGVLVIVAFTILVITIIKRKKIEADLEEDVDPYRPSFKDDNDDEDVKKEDFTGIYKQQILSDDEMEQQVPSQETGHFKTYDVKGVESAEEENVPQDDEDYVPEIKAEKNLDNMEMTRRFSTNYDYTLEQYKKNKNIGKGKHF